MLFALNATALLYFHLRTCRTDPGFIRVTEEEKKMVRKPEEPRRTQSGEQLLDSVQLISFVFPCVWQNVLVLAEAGCLDPRIFCTSCMVGLGGRLRANQELVKQ